MSTRVLLLSVLCLSLLAPARAGASHELPHIDPATLPQTVAQTVNSQTVNRVPQQFGGFLHVDRTTDRWSVDCTHPALGPRSGPCAMVAEGALADGDHIGPVDAPPCAIPDGSGGTGRWAPGNPGYHPADLADLQFAGMPAVQAAPTTLGSPAVLVVHGSWSDDLGRADRFAAALHVIPISCGQTSHYGISFGSGWALGLR